MSEALFVIAGVLTLGGGLGVVATRNVVHAALSLLLSLLAVAGLYLLLFAEFLALVQILIYGGAILIVLVFAIMLTRSREYPRISDNPQWPLAIVAGLAVFGVLTAAFVWNPVGDVAVTTEVKEAGHAVDLNGDGTATDTEVAGPFNEIALGFDLDGDGLLFNVALAGPLDEKGPYGVDLNRNGEIDAGAVKPGLYEVVYGADLNGDGDQLDVLTAAADEAETDLNGDGDATDLAVPPGFYEPVYGAVLDGDNHIGNASQAFGLSSLGESLFTTWAVPFEVVSLVLLVALIGAIVIARAGGRE